MGSYTVTSVNGKSLPTALTSSGEGGATVLASDTLVLSAEGFVETLHIEGADGSASPVVFRGDWSLDGDQVRLISGDGTYEHVLKRTDGGLVTLNRRLTPGTDELLVFAFGKSR